jgi:hypothetical protein
MFAPSKRIFQPCWCPKQSPLIDRKQNGKDSYIHMAPLSQVAKYNQFPNEMEF